MRIEPVSQLNSLNPVSGVGSVRRSGKAEGSEGVSFGQTMKKVLGEVNSLQQNADTQAIKLATGDVEDVHKAMIAMNKAKLAFDLTLQVRNKVVEAYQEIMRMQV